MMTTVSSLVLVAKLQEQVALAVAYAGGIGLHFTLNRRFVFAGHRFALGLTVQGIRYLIAALTSYGLTALAVATLPQVLDVPGLAVYLATAVVLGAATFVVFRVWVFSSDQNRHDGPPKTVVSAPPNGES